MIKNPQGGYFGKIPAEAIVSLEQELAGIVHGKVTIDLHIRDGKLTRYTVAKEQSFLAAGTGCERNNTQG
jgi:hypothetical protein